MVKKTFRGAVALAFLVAVRGAFADGVTILTNQLGYEQNGAKQFIVEGADGDNITGFKLIDQASGKEVLAGTPTKTGAVDQWKKWVFWSADFSAVTTEGTYVVECATDKGAVRSYPFLIQKDLLERNTLSNVIYYFKGQRSSGLLDKADNNLHFEDSTKVADVHGGWFDATGDYGKHLSHLSFSTYFNPQQIPFTDWTLLTAFKELKRRGDPPPLNFRQYERRLLDEALWGADYLVRVKNPVGSFYRSVSAPGGEKAPQDRRIAKEGTGFAIKTLETKNTLKNGAMSTPMSGNFPYEVGFRNGGGMAIAALALASSFPVSGEFSSGRYIQAAKDGFAYLSQHNLEYANDGKENIVDDYCALMAATELYRATKDDQYKTAADARAKNLMARLITTEKLGTYWRADDGDRPFFHAADAGLPVVSLLNYYEIADPAAQKDVLATVRKSMEAELAVTGQVTNPFGYARQIVQSKDGSRRAAFFYPHDTETAPWWQGENARLGSLASAARLTARYFPDDKPFHDQLEAYATSQLNWILGENPFDSSMLYGTGRNNIAYMFFTSYEYTCAPGGIINGITGGITNPDDIDYNLGYAVTGKDEDWRWGEQWLPHASWYLYAVTIGN